MLSGRTLKEKDIVLARLLSNNHRGKKTLETSENIYSLIEFRVFTFKYIYIYVYIYIYLKHWGKVVLT